MPTPRDDENDWTGDGRAAEDESSSPAICDHCGNPFYLGQGVVTQDMALCDICNGD